MKKEIALWHDYDCSDDDQEIPANCLLSRYGFGYIRELKQNGSLVQRKREKKIK
jgi:hypothetical protein